jgi:hypothetical protein
MARTEAQVEMNRETLQVKQATAAATYEAAMERLRLERELAMLTLANNQQTSLETIRAQLAGIGIKERSKQDMQALEIELANRKGEGI